eukprot:3901313-Rhodomonas_salina.3
MPSQPGEQDSRCEFRDHTRTLRTEAHRAVRVWLGARVGNWAASRLGERGSCVPASTTDY